MNTLQRAAMRRKIAYFAAILFMFTFSMLWRGKIPLPLARSTAQAAQPFRWASERTIESQAQRLEISEFDPNETQAEVTGSAARLLLTGSRGFVVTWLWLSAYEKQKRNDFHEFEQRVELVTKLQPHFITPWIFQSWNITYNISVEMHGSGDMYYYIVRGIQLLAEGERRNKRSPDMRYQIAFYYQNKFGVSDQVETLRCMFDLSCIPWSKRNPDNFTDPTTGEINYDAFRRFCEGHPHFVRRLRGEDLRLQDRQAREKLRAPEPKHVIQFLRDKARIPSRYKDRSDELADADKQFPVLPPQFNEGPNEAHPGIATPDDFAPGIGYFSAYKAARAWFSYSLLLLPPPMRDDQGNAIPGPPPPPGMGGHDPSRHRIPRMPTLILFRQGPPRAQSYQAELEQKEGWFDGEGWRIEGWFPDEPQGVVVGSGRDWSLEEWRQAFNMWRRHGNDYALSLGDRYATMERLANEVGQIPANVTPEQFANEDFRKRYLARLAIEYYYANRNLTNFPYFFESARAEQEPATVQARKTLWQADQARKIGEPHKAIRLYHDGLKQWKKVMEANPNFHRATLPDRGERGEEETYEYELAYFRLLVEHDERVREYANKLSGALNGVVPFLPPPFPHAEAAQNVADPFWPTANKEEIRWIVVETVSGADFSSPFVGTFAADGSPWVREQVKDSVLTKQGINRAPVAQPESNMPNQVKAGGG